MRGYMTNIEKESLKNTDFRRVLFTGPNVQLVLMSLKPGEEIGTEVHRGHDQFFRVEAGRARAMIADDEYDLVEGSVIVVPAGARHNVVNASPNKDLKLYTLYSPPQHPDGTVHHTKAIAEAAEAVHH